MTIDPRAAKVVSRKQEGRAAIGCTPLFLVSAGDPWVGPGEFRPSILPLLRAAGLMEDD